MMKRKCLLALLPALLALASCGNVPKVEPKPELNNIVEDTLAHDEIFGKSKIAGNLGVRKAYDADVDVPEDYVSTLEPTIGIQTKTTGDKISIRFVAAIKIVDFNHDDVIDSLDLADTNVFWIRSIYEDDGDVTVVSATKQSTTVYTALAAPSDVEDDGIDDSILTIDEFNNEVPGRDYTHFAVYTLLDLPLSLGDYYINVAVGRTNITNGFYPSISKQLATTIDQKTQFTFAGTGYFAVVKAESEFVTYGRANHTDVGNHAQFENVEMVSGDSFVIVNKYENVDDHSHDFFQVYGYDKAHAADPSDSNFKRDGDSQFAKSKTDKSYILYLSNGYETPNYIYAAECHTKVYYLTPNSNWLESTPRFALYVELNNTSAHWYSMSKVGDENVYECEVYYASASEINYMIFVRMNGATTDNNWDNKWNETAHLGWKSDANNKYSVKDGWWNDSPDDGQWSTYVAPVPEP